MGAGHVSARLDVFRTDNAFVFRVIECAPCHDVGRLSLGGEKCVGCDSPAKTEQRARCHAEEHTKKECTQSEPCVKHGKSCASLETCEQEAGEGAHGDGRSDQELWDRLVSSVPEGGALYVRVETHDMDTAAVQEVLRAAYAGLADASFKAGRPLLDISVGPYYSLEEKGTKSTNQQVCNTVAVAGTFDHLHAGHRLMLCGAGLRARTRLVVGVCDGPLVAGKRHAARMQPWDVRATRVRSFLSWLKCDLEVTIVRLVDPVGPAGDNEAAIDALVVSNETLGGAAHVNSVRAARGLPALRVAVVQEIRVCAEHVAALGASVASDSATVRVSSTLIRSIVAMG